MSYLPFTDRKPHPLFSDFSIESIAERRLTRINTPKPLYNSDIYVDKNSVLKNIKQVFVYIIFRLS